MATIAEMNRGLGIIATGAEPVPPETGPALGQIRDSNGPMRSAMACDVGFDRPVALHAEDRLDAIIEAVQTLADRDIVLVTGGVSVGNHGSTARMGERTARENRLP
jgi:molybdopterin molybdotransferase